jgi:hypothetical protein
MAACGGTEAVHRAEPASKVPGGHPSRRSPPPVLTPGSTLHLDKGRGLVFGPRAFACHGDCIPGAPGSSWLTALAWLSKLRCARFGGSSIPLGVRPPYLPKKGKTLSGLVGKTGLYGIHRKRWAFGGAVGRCVKPTKRGCTSPTARRGPSGSAQRRVEAHAPPRPGSGLQERWTDGRRRRAAADSPGDNGPR